MVFVVLIENIALLLAASLLHGLFVGRAKPRRVPRELMSGIIFGLATLAAMSGPFELSPGVVFDGRSIAISLAGMFGGPLAAAITVVLGTLHRLYTGGGGTLTGVCVVVTSGVLGTAFFYLRQRREYLVQPLYLYGFGLLVHINMLLWMLTLPRDAMIPAYKAVGLPVIALYPFATLLLGVLLTNLEARAASDQALQESEARYRTIAGSLPGGIIHVMDREYRYVFSAGSELANLGLTHEMLVGKSIHDVLPPDVAQMVAGHYAKAFSGHPCSYEGTYKDQTFLVNATPLPKPDGTIDSILVLSLDITARKAAERKLREREELLAEMSRMAKIGAWEFDPETLEGTWTEEVARIHDRDPEASTSVAVGLGDYAESSRPIIENAVKRAIEEGEPYDLELELVTARQSRKWVRTVGQPVKQGGQVVKVRGTFQDITEKKRAEEALRENEAILKAAMDNSVAGIAIADAPDGQMRYVNDAGLLMRGKSREEVVNGSGIEQYVASWRISHLDGTPYRDDEVPLARAILFGETCCEELVIGRANEEFCIVWVSATPIRNAEGEVIAGIAVFLDITERKQAEETLRESEERFARLFNTSPVAMSISGLSDGKYTEVNDAWCNLMGFSREEAVGCSVEELGIIDHSMKSKLREEFDRKGALKSIDTEIATKGGAKKSVLSSVNLFLARGRQYAVNALVDITERRQLEGRLQEHQHFLQQVLDTEPGVVYIYDLEEGQTIYVNQHWLTAYGYSPEETKAMGSNLFGQVFHPDDFARIGAHHEDWRRASAGEMRELEYRIRTKDGQWRWLHSREAAFARDDSGQVRQILGIAHDVTARVQTERALREKEYLLSESQRIARIGSWSWDFATDVLSWSDEAYRIYGVSPETFALTAESFLDLLHPDDRAAMQAWIEACLAGRGPGDLECRAVLPDRNIRPLNGRGQLICDGDGNPVRMVGTVQDITERKRVEEQLKEYQRNLEKRVEERTAQLEARNSEIEAFSYSVSHDLRAPLRAISGFAQIIARRHRSDLNEEGRHYFDNIVQASKQMDRLIEDLLALSRLGRKAVRRAPVSLRPFLDELRTQFSSRIETEHATFSVPDALPTILSDSTLLSIIFTNLVDNALNYRRMDSGHRVEILCDEGESAVRLRIADNGIGISPEFHEKIFAVFQRLHSQDQYPGTGIGLALVKKAVDLLDGNVWVESQIGEGSTFFVELPARPS